MFTRGTRFWHKKSQWVAAVEVETGTTVAHSAASVPPLTWAVPMDVNPIDAKQKWWKNASDGWMMDESWLDDGWIMGGSWMDLELDNVI